MSQVLDYIKEGKSQVEDMHLLDKGKRKLGLKKEEPKLIDTDNLCPSLTWKQRAIGFGCCIAVSVCINIVSWILLTSGEYVGFAVSYSIGNIVGIVSTLFLSGPVKQIKSMFKETRIIATCLFLGFLVATIVCAIFIPKCCKVLPTILCAICQYVALIWYGLSYIPFARTAVKSCFKGVVTSV
eukprot:TRINITY_DN66606_c5_g5_i1.p1 TRINITY_DN66606_c5_g5~~TRINITY_DN66606_c5_g5_i1.p1  ORF type:complete len:183 (-),score=11.93 TRINITY_DN66606_c5_g5_i1:272-820(-)